MHIPVIPSDTSDIVSDRVRELDCKRGAPKIKECP